MHAAQRRGAEVFACDLAESLKQRGHEVETWALHDGDASLSVDRRCGLPEFGAISRVIGVDPNGLRLLKLAVARVKPDIIQLNGASTVKYGAWLRRSQGNQPPWRIVYRNIGSPSYWMRDWKRKLYYRYLVMPNMDGVVALTSSIAEEIRSVHRLGAPIRVIPNAINPDRVGGKSGRAAIRSRLGVPEDAVVFAYLGALTREKAPDRLLDVVEQVPGAVGWVLGAGPLRAGLEARSAQQGRVRFFGHVTEVGDVLGGADILIVPSLTEGMPAAVFEAGLLGIPAVACRVGGLASCIKDGETGVLVDPATPEGLVAAAHGLAVDPARRRAMGEAARRHVSANFTIASVTPAFEAFFASLIEARS